MLSEHEKDYTRKIVHVLETGEHSMSVTDEMRTQANRPLERMLELAK